MHHRKSRVASDLDGLGNDYGNKRILCIWWDLEDVVYHELLKSSETVNSAWYQQQFVNVNHILIIKRQKWVILPILPPDNSTPHTSKLVNKHVKRLCVGNITTSAAFIRPWAVRISLVPVDSPHTV
ncbi:hypothetical protein AVEN_244722-1 [Araneus ventricosus]|uniref:Mariner Mos1 transposase n=1 Tax=Araneus ventricosus TaxID=182803 RepID=A0A4Y2BTF9_ARAVE|nr:hypothetical protein AVEN_244722-1 [Araneus ventricosus]